MIGYALFGSNDLPRSFAFYDALFASVGISRLMEFPTGAVCWGTSWTAPMLGVGPAYDGQPATAGNGTMIALVLDTRAKVDAMHAAALAATDTSGAHAEGAAADTTPKGEGKKKAKKD